eukprot:scaffold8151_cov67-Skeletonema_dohrnii-CCMP3373.AAC.1
MTNRPCKAEIRWYDGKDDGLFDVRPLIDLWGNQSEIKRWRELRLDPANAELSDTDISEIVLNEDWPSRLRKEHIERISAL